MKDRTDPTNRDTVPAMLTPGEFVVNKEATQMYADQLKAMNNNGLALRAKRNSMVGVPPAEGGVPQFNEGGEAKGNWWTNLVGDAGYWKEKDKAQKQKWKESLETGVPMYSGREMMSILPVVGDAISVEEIYKELRKPNPNYYLIGALGGATLLGAIPGVGPAAKKIAAKGARAALSGVKAVPRIRPRPYDPSRMGMNDAVYFQSENVGRRDFHPAFNEKTGKYEGGVSMEDRQAFINHKAQQTRNALQKEGLTPSQQKLLDEYNESVAKFDKAVSEGKGSLLSPSQVMKKPDFNIGVTRHTTGTDVLFDADSFNYRPIAINKSGVGEGDFIFTSNLDDNYDSVFAAKSGGIPLHLLPESQQTLHKNMMAYKLDSDRNFIKDAAGNKIPKIRYNEAGEELSNIPIKQPYIYNVAYNENPRPTRSGFMDTQTNLKEIAVPDVNVRRIDRVWPPNPDDWDAFWKNNYNTGGLVSFLKDKEGFEGEAYPDLGWIKDEDGNRIRPKKGSKWTIGYGRIFNDDGSPVKQGDTTDRKSEDAWLDSRAKKEYDAVKKFSDDEGYGWNQNQLEAFASFRFNAGPENFKMLAHKNRGQPGFMDVPEKPGYDIRYNRSTQEMIDKMPLYKNVDGKEVKGLVARRAAEVDLAGPVPYDKRYQGWEVPTTPESNNWMSNMLKTIGKGEAMKGAMIPGYNNGGMPMEDDDIMNFIMNYQGKLGDVNPEDVAAGIISDEDLLQNSSDAGANSFMQANEMQYGDPRQSIPMPGAFMGNITDAQSLRAGVVRPDMMPSGYVPPVPSSTSPQGGADRIALNNLNKALANPETNAIGLGPEGTKAGRIERINRRKFLDGISTLEEQSRRDLIPDFSPSLDSRAMSALEVPYNQYASSRDRANFKMNEELEQLMLQLQTTPIESSMYPVLMGRKQFLEEQLGRNEGNTGVEAPQPYTLGTDVLEIKAAENGVKNEIAKAEAMYEKAVVDNDRETMEYADGLSKKAQLRLAEIEARKEEVNRRNSLAQESAQNKRKSQAMLKMLDIQRQFELTKGEERKSRLAEELKKLDKIIVDNGGVSQLESVVKSSQEKGKVGDDTVDPEKQKKIDQIVGSFEQKVGGRLPANLEDAAATGKLEAEGKKVDPKSQQYAAAKSFLQDIFGDLFNKKDLIKAITIYLGARIFGASGNQAGAMAGKYYLGKQDAHEATVAAYAKSGKYTSESVAAYEKSRNVADLVPIGKPAVPTGVTKTLYGTSKTGKPLKIEVAEYNLGPNHNVWKRKSRLDDGSIGWVTVDPTRWSEDGSRVEGTAEYRTRYNLLYDQAKELTKEQLLYKDPDDDNKEKEAVPGLKPNTAAGQLTRWAIENDIDIGSSSYALGLAINMAKQEVARNESGKVTDLTPHLNQAFIVAEVNGSGQSPVAFKNLDGEYIPYKILKDAIVNVASIASENNPDIAGMNPVMRQTAIIEFAGDLYKKYATNQAATGATDVFVEAAKNNKTTPLYEFMRAYR